MESLNNNHISNNNTARALNFSEESQRPQNKWPLFNSLPRCRKSNYENVKVEKGNEETRHNFERNGKAKYENVVVMNGNLSIYENVSSPLRENQVS